MSKDEPADPGATSKPKRSGPAQKLPPAVADYQPLLDILRIANFDHTPLTDEERASKIRIAEADAEHLRAEAARTTWHVRLIELISLGAVLVIGVIVCPCCLWVLTDQTIPQERKSWAAPILTLMLGGIVGFLTGRLPAKSSGK